MLIFLRHNWKKLHKETKLFFSNVTKWFPVKKQENSTCNTMQNDLEASACLNTHQAISTTNLRTAHLVTHWWVFPQWHKVPGMVDGRQVRWLANGLTSWALALRSRLPPDQSDFAPKTNQQLNYTQHQFDILVMESTWPDSDLGFLYVAEAHLSFNCHQEVSAFSNEYPFSSAYLNPNQQVLLFWTIYL